MAKFKAVLGVKLLMALIMLFALLSESSLGAALRSRFATLNYSQVVKKWGSMPFDPVKFKKSEINERAPLAASILKEKKSYFGKTVRELREIFGTPDGFYHLDWNPAYLIHEAKDENDATWQLVFLIDKDRKVSDIIVHKNCCY